MSQLDDYLNTVIAIRDGKEIRRRDEMSFREKRILESVWPIAFKAGYKTGVTDAKADLPTAVRRSRAKLPASILP